MTEFVDEKTSDGHGSGAYQKAHTAFLTQGKNNSFFIITSEVASNHHVSFRKWQSAIVLDTEQGISLFRGFCRRGSTNSTMGHLTLNIECDLRHLFSFIL